MKYIIDDSDIQSVLHAYDQNEVMDVFEWLTPVPELPVKPWRERMEGSGLYQAADTGELMAMQAEITELRALCQAQAAEVEKWLKRIEVLSSALVTVANWKLPTEDYEWNMGSNGARDYMRRVADKALCPTPPNPASAEKE